MPTERHILVLRTVQSCPGIDAPRITQATQLSQSIVYRYLNQLRGKGLIHSMLDPHRPRTRLYFPGPHPLSRQTSPVSSLSLT
ncbi:MAG: ArsR family transcriptional regulator [Leptolyngbyaceae cyanobacterium bins.59]|nr:ArsR family transcriptional regulator [Leptolyngbyaceae cyanobacterium bins.59]